MVHQCHRFNSVDHRPENNDVPRRWKNNSDCPLHPSRDLTLPRLSIIRTVSLQHPGLVPLASHRPIHITSQNQMDDATEHRSILLGSPPKRRRADEGDAGSPGGRSLRSDVPPPELMPQLALAAAGASAEGAADLPPGLPQAEDVLGDPSLVAGGSAVPDAAAGGTETEMWEEGRHPARDARPAPIPEAVAARGPPVLPGLGPIVKDRNGRTPFGRIRSCMCAAPLARCRWWWRRSGQGMA